jgi:hypothetical protein
MVGISIWTTKQELRKIKEELVINWKEKLREIKNRDNWNNIIRVFIIAPPIHPLSQVI